MGFRVERVKGQGWKGAAVAAGGVLIGWVGIDGGGRNPVALRGGIPGIHRVAIRMIGEQVGRKVQRKKVENSCCVRETEMRELVHRAGSLIPSDGVSESEK